MTTLELIEKYGIGHNCLSDAYALGMMHGLDRLEEACELAEEKARVDAIDEILKLPRNTYKTYEHGFIESEEAIFVSDILDLKEQK